MQDLRNLIPDTKVSSMLPNPHIKSATDVVPATDAGTESLHIALLNAENRALADGADPRSLPLLSSVVRLQETAYDGITDNLSGLLNREGIEMWFDRYRPTKFLVIKSDGIAFGEVNKQYGHDTGDRVIQHIGEMVTSKLRTDKKQVDHEERKQITTHFDAVASVTSRWGGDEFLSIVDLSNVADKDLERAKKSIMNRFQNFGTYDDSVVGPIDIEFRSAGMLGFEKDNQPFSYYQSNVDRQLGDLTTTK